MGKKDPLKDKPKPPSNQEIIEDLSKAAKSDIVFQMTLSGSQYTTMLHADSGSSNSSTSVDASNSQTDRTELDRSQYTTMLHADAGSSNSSTSVDASNSQTDNTEIDNTYEKLTDFIEKYEQLQKEPEILKNKYEHLRQLGEEVSDSISELKSAAENVSGKA